MMNITGIRGDYDAHVYHYYQSHHELIGPLLTLFGLGDMTLQTHPGDSFVIELFKSKKFDSKLPHDNQYLVRVSYVNYKLPKGQMPKHKQITLKSFFKIVEHNYEGFKDIFGEVKKASHVCNSKVSSLLKKGSGIKQLTSLRDPEKFIKILAKMYKAKKLYTDFITNFKKKQKKYKENKEDQSKSLMQEES